MAAPCLGFSMELKNTSIAFFISKKPSAVAKVWNDNGYKIISLGEIERETVPQSLVIMLLCEIKHFWIHMKFQLILRLFVFMTLGFSLLLSLLLLRVF